MKIKFYISIGLHKMQQTANSTYLDFSIASNFCHPVCWQQNNILWYTPT